MEKVLITGSNGFIGQSLQKKLEENPQTEIWTLDRKGSGKRHFNTGIREFSDYNEFDTIYHLAAITDTSTDNHQMWKVNFEGTKHIVSKLQGDQELIFPSSAYVYDISRKGIKSEKNTTSPCNFYGLTKKLSEEYIQYSSSEKGFEYKILRLFPVYGPNQSKGYLIPDIIQKIKNNQEPTVKEANTKISLVFIDDVIDILISDEITGGPYNICGECYKIKEIYKIIGHLLDNDIGETKDTKREYICGDNSSISKFKNNWTSLEEGINKMI